jgi:hypothetical protein
MNSRDNTLNNIDNQNPEMGGNLPVMRNIQIPAIRNNPYSPKFRQYSRSRTEMPDNWQQMPKVQNNNQFYNNQQYIQVGLSINLFSIFQDMPYRLTFDVNFALLYTVILMDSFNFEC